MQKHHYFFYLLFMGILFLQSCASTGYSLREPHYFNNSFNQVIKAIEMVLASEKMVIMNAEELDENTYQIYFFKQSSRIDERDFETGHTAEIKVMKHTDRRTSVQIKENTDRALVRDEYREHLARDVFKELKEILVLEEKEAA